MDRGGFQMKASFVDELVGMASAVVRTAVDIRESDACCRHCLAFADSAPAIDHADNCPVTTAERVLAEASLMNRPAPRLVGRRAGH